MLTVTAFFMFAPVGALIAIYQPSQPIGWLFCAVGLLYQLWSVMEGYGLYGLVTNPGSLPGAVWTGVVQLPIGITPWMLLIFSLIIFPTGRYLTQRWGIAARTILAVYALTILLEPLALSTLDPIQVPNPLRVAELGGVGDFLLVARNFLGLVVVNVFAASIVVRFRRSRGDERKQLQWLAYAATLWIPPTVAALAINSVFDDPAVQAAVSSASSVIFSFTLAALAVAVGIAIWKHRLYDIDIIIRRTLVYSILTLLVALTYWVGVALLQAALRPLTGEGNDLAIVATTLAVTAVFFPLRRLMQQFIDRRFYRRKYDAARTLAAFGQVARDEVDLDALKGRLLAVVDETMQPALVSLWLRPTVRGGRPAAPEERL